MRFDHADDHLDAFAEAFMRRLEHGIGFADAGRGAEKDLQPTPRFPLRLGQQGIR